MDEPVAAALGYGVDVGHPTTLVAFDFGAGTMEAAAVRTHRAETVRTGRADVLAKQGLALGGDDVDGWILDFMVPGALLDWPEWEVALRWEAERAKLLASAGREARFTFRNETWGTLDHEGLRELLAEVFGREKVREWLPFESVARGACVFAAGGRVDDHIYHDYGLRVLRDDGAVEYELLIPAGTRFPTAEDEVVRYYAPGWYGSDDRLHR